jgi:hyperosmotically inducible protein
MRRFHPAVWIVLAAVIVSATWAGAAEDEESSWSATLTELRVKTALLEKLGADALAISVSVAGTRAVLDGTVEKRATQELAEEVALAVEGIASVDDRLRLEPESGGTAERATRDAGREIDDAMLESRVKLTLFNELGKHASRIEVEAVDGVVSLRGVLPDRDREKLALRTARGVSGVKKVVDLLKHSD